MMMINDEDRPNVIVNEDDDDMIVREIMKMLMYIESIAGWGVVPRIAPPPTQGGFNVRGERERWQER